MMGLSMSTVREAMESIIATAPDFGPDWERFQSEWVGEEFPWYLAMGELAHHIVNAYESERRGQFTAFFSAVESVLGRADPEVENLVAVGLFEDIQNIASHRSFGAEPFRDWLGPRSLALWEQIELGWQRLAEETRIKKVGWWEFWKKREEFDPEQALSKVESPELRKLIKTFYRKNR